MIYYFVRLGDRLVQLDEKNVASAADAGMDVLELVERLEAEVPHPSRPRQMQLRFGEPVSSTD